MKIDGQFKFLKNNYNVAAVFFSVVGMLLVIYFIDASSKDSNLTYYLISVSAIYSTIQLSYLMQKLMTIRQQKEHLLTCFNNLWESVIHYRYLCAIAENYLTQNDYQRFRRAKALKAERAELLHYHFTGNKDDIDAMHLSEFIASHIPLKYVLMIKQMTFFTKDIYRHASYNNRIFANKNDTINAYIKGMLEDPVFSLMKDITIIPEQEILLFQLSEHNFYKAFQVKAGLTNKETVIENMIKIERYVLNEVLFKLYDHTFIIERKLSFAFKHLLINSFITLSVGTILPLFNAFFVESPTVTWGCGRLTLAALMQSITHIALTFHDENAGNFFEHIPIVYEGKERQF